MLEGKAVLVTGGSNGIGRACCVELAKLGADIVINDVNEDSAAQVLKEVESLGRNAIIVKADIGKFAQAQNLIERAVERFGKIDILVNNAGITRDSMLLRMKEEDFDAVIETNLKGAFNCAKFAAGHMAKAKSGSIINISSIVGLRGNAGQVNYSSAKAGIIGLTKSLAKELASRNITVNAIAPGFIETRMTEALSLKLRDEAIGAIPLKRFGTSLDVAKAVVFFASDSSRYITGQVLAVDGGMAI